MALLIAYMFNFHYAPSTVTTYISALGYSHKLLGFPDPSKVFYVSQILKGYKKVGFRLDSRLPIYTSYFGPVSIDSSIFTGVNLPNQSVSGYVLFGLLCLLAYKRNDHPF